MAQEWDPDQYARFYDERKRPFLDLLAMVQRVPGGSAADLGCGTGDLTRVLHETKQLGETVGIDTSEAMLARARRITAPGIAFELGSFQRFAPDPPVDLVFSNSALQWAPDHEALFNRLTAGLAASGQLAVQMPANHDHPAQVIADRVAQEEPFATELEGFTWDWPVRDAAWYTELLHRLGFHGLNVRVQVYPHLLASLDEVVEWERATYLLPTRAAWAQRRRHVTSNATGSNCTQRSQINDRTCTRTSVSSCMPGSVEHRDHLARKVAALCATPGAM